MAKQRVQIQDLPEAPSLQPTVQSGGQYSVAVQQAGRNKLLDLADTLKQVNPALRNYGTIQDLDAERFEKELQRLSPEERRKLVSQERDEMDKLVRKNVIPFMGNAWNWKRKSRAIGALMHDEFQQNLQKNLDDPALADQSVDEIVQMTREALEEGAPILTTDTYAREGFQEAINPTVNAYKLKYGKIKDDAERLRIKDALQASMFQYSAFGMDALRDAAPSLLKEWNDAQGALTPAQLFDIIERVAKTHAAGGNMMAANAWVDFASSELKVGTAIMGDPSIKDDDVYGRYTDKVALLRAELDRIDEARGDEDIKEARRKLAEIGGDASQLFNRVANHDFSKGPLRVDPDDPNSEIIKEPNEGYNYLFKKYSGDENPFVVAELAKTLRSAEGLAEIPDTNLVPLNNTFQTLFGPAVRESLENTDMTVKVTASELSSETTTLQYLAKASEAKQRYFNKINEARNVIGSGRYLTVTDDLITNETDLEVMSRHLKQWSDKYAEEYAQEIETLNADVKKIQEVTKLQARPSGEDQDKDAEEQQSFIYPNKLIEDISPSGVGVMGDWENLEEAAVEGNEEDGKESVKELRDNGALIEAYNTLQGKTKLVIRIGSGSLETTVDSTPEQKRVAARKLMLAMVADGVLGKGDRAILEGRAKFNLGKGQSVIVDLDMKALEKLIPLYPLITRKRAEAADKANQNGTDYDASYVRELLSKLKGVPEENIFDQQINDFLKQQLEVHKRFNTE